MKYTAFIGASKVWEHNGDSSAADKRTAGPGAKPLFQGGIAGGIASLDASQFAGAKGRHFDPGYAVAVAGGFDDDDGSYMSSIGATRQSLIGGLFDCISLLVSYYAIFGEPALSYDPTDPKPTTHNASLSGVPLTFPGPYSVTPTYRTTIQVRQAWLQQRVVARVGHNPLLTPLLVRKIPEACAKRVNSHDQMVEVQGGLRQSLSAWWLTPGKQRELDDEFNVPTKVGKLRVVRQSAPSTQTSSGMQASMDIERAFDLTWTCLNDVAVELGIDLGASEIRRETAQLLLARVSPKLAAAIAEAPVAAILMAQTVLQSQVCRDADGYIHQALRNQISHALRARGFDATAKAVEVGLDARSETQKALYTISDVVAWIVDKVGDVAFENDPDPEIDWSGLLELPGSLWQLLSTGKTDSAQQKALPASTTRLEEAEGWKPFGPLPNSDPSDWSGNIPNPFKRSRENDEGDDE
jgi:hypothetical protein